MKEMRQETTHVRVWQETYVLLSEESERSGVPVVRLLHRIVRQALRTPGHEKERTTICKEARQEMTW